MFLSITIFIIYIQNPWKSAFYRKRNLIFSAMQMTLYLCHLYKKFMKKSIFLESGILFFPNQLNFKKRVGFDWKWCNCSHYKAKIAICRIWNLFFSEQSTILQNRIGFEWEWCKLSSLNYLLSHGCQVEVFVSKI